jgi:phosphoribosyl 1,2-cyclic phosphate phosphodiesterase
LKVIFLGTGTSQGVPLIGCNCEVCSSSDPNDSRLRSSVFLEVNNKNILIDIGPDFRQQILREKISQLDAVLITHPHRDHIAGLDDIRSLNWFNQKPLDIYCEANVEKEIRQIFAYAFAEKKYPGVPEININQISTDVFKIDDVVVAPIRAMHYKMPILGFRINDFTYITDINYIAQEEIEKIVGTKFFVINALRKEKHLSHYSLEEALKLIQQVSPKRAYITHICHQMGLHQEVQKELPANVMLSYDGLKIIV